MNAEEAQLAQLGRDLMVCEREYSKAIAEGKCFVEVKPLYMKIKQLELIVTIVLQETLS